MTAEGIADLELGRAAEHLVVADLILPGYRVYLTYRGLPYDVVIDYEGRLYRVQVKATRDAKKIPQRGAVGLGYLFNIRRAGKGGRRQYADDEFDIIALVAIDIRIIAYLPSAGHLLQTINLRPPGHGPSPRTERTHTIDQYPIETVLAVLAGKRPVLAPRLEPARIVPSDQGRLFEGA